MAADVNANIGVGIDTSDALSQLKNLQRQLSQFHTSVAKSSETAAIAQRDLQKNFINSINAIQGFSAELRTVKTTAESFTSSLEKNKFSIKEYFRYAAGATNAFGKSFRAEFDTIEKTAIERVKTLQTQYVKLGRDANGAMQAIAVRPTILDMNNLGTQTQIAGQKSAIFNQLVKQGSTQLLNFGKNTQWAGRQLMVGFTLPLATLGMTASKTFMQMEQAALKFRKVYGDLFTTQADTQAALDGIINLAKGYTQYGVAVADTIGLAADAAAAGYQGVDLQNQTNAATKLSVLGQIDQQKSLETTIALQNAFAMSSDKLATTIDFLNAVENQTVVSLDDITTALPKVAPVIMQLGGDVKDLTFFLAAMKEGGINASEGANALKSGLGALINPTKKASDMLAGYGINVRDIVNRNQGDLKTTVTEFATALDKLAPLERSRAIEQMFGKFQFARLSTLFQNVSKDGTQASRVLALAGSSVSDLSRLSEKELGQTAASSMNKFKKAVEDVKLALAPLGQMFLEIATPFVDFAKTILDGFNAMPDGIRKAIGTIVAVVGGLGPILLMTFGLFNNGIANMIKFFATVRLGYLKITGQAKNIGSETQYMTTEQLNAAAAAASLEQSHSKLTQQFTVEKAAVDALKVAYQQAVAAGERFATINPGMMQPKTAVKRGAKKFASGGIVPGSGNSDSVPSMLTPGEWVVPKDEVAMLQEAMSVAKQFKKPRIGSSGEGAKGKSQFTIPRTTSANTSAGKGGTTAFTDIDPTNMADVTHAYAKDIIKESGISAKSVNLEISAWQEKNKAAIRAAAEAVNAGTPATEAYAKLAKQFKTDMETANGPTHKFTQVAKKMYPELAKDLKSTQEYVKKSKIDLQTGAGTAKLAADLPASRAARLMAQSGSASSYQGIAKNRGALTTSFAGAEKFGTTGVPGFMVPNDMDESTLIKKARSTQDHVNKTLAQEAQIEHLKQLRRAEKNGAEITQASARGAKREAAKAQGKNDPYMMNRDRNSPHAKAAKDGADDAKAYVAASTQAAKASAGQYRDPVTGRFASAPTAGAASSGISTKAVAETESRFNKLNSNINKAGYALSALSGVGTMLGGTIGEISGIIFTASSAFVGLSSVIQLATQSTLAEVVAIRAATVAESVKAASGVESLFSRGGGLVGLFGNLKNGLSFVTRFLGPVGIGLGILAVAIPAFAAVAEEQKRKIIGLGDTAYLTAEKMKLAGELLGFTPSGTDFAGTFAAPEGVTSQQATKATPLSQNEKFLNKDTGFGNQIEALKRATVSEAQAALQAMAVRLLSEGADSEAVATMLTALTKAAERTDISLKVATEIDLSTPEGQQKISQIGQQAANILSKSVQNGIPKGGLTDAQTAAASQAAGTYATLFTALKSGLENATIDAVTFNTQMGNISSQIDKLDPKVLQQVIPQISKSLGIDQQMADLMTYEDRILAIKAATAGLKIKPEDMGSVSKARGNADAKTMAAATNIRKKWNDAVATGAQKLLDEKAATDANTKSKEALNAVSQASLDFSASKEKEIENINNQKIAYKLLRASGMDAATALTAVADATFASALAGAKTEEDRKKLIADMKELASIRKTAPGYKAPTGTESPYQQALKSIKEQKTQAIAASAAYAILTKRGMDASKAIDIANNSTLQTAVASGKVKVGSKEWEELVKQIQSADAAIKKFERSTTAGKKAFFDDTYGKVQNLFSAQEALLEAANTQATKADNDLIAKLEKQIEGLNRQTTDLEHQLDGIAEKEDAINTAYDAKVKALEQVKALNEDITRQQKDQLSIADALSQGDVSAAARAIQESRAGNASAAMDSQGNMLDTARQAQLAAVTSSSGKTRKELEASIKLIKEQIYTIENGSLQSARDRVTAANEQLAKDQAALIVHGKTKLEWDNVKASTDKAQASAALYKSDVNTALTYSKNILSTWNALNKKFTTTHEIITINTTKKSGAAGASTGGMIPKYLADGGWTSRGTDTVPAMLTPGEFVVNKSATDKFGPMLSAINSGTFGSQMSDIYAKASKSRSGAFSQDINSGKTRRGYGDATVAVGSAGQDQQLLTQFDNSVYNYNLSVNVEGSNASATDIANVVMAKLRNVRSQQVRGQVVK